MKLANKYPGILSAEIFFLIIGMVFGILFLINIPPFQIPDERSHFAKAYSLSDGNLVGTEVLIPGSIGELLNVVSALPFHQEKHIYKSDITQFMSVPLYSLPPVLQNFPGTSVYSPFPYLFSTIAIFLGKLTSPPVLIFFYLGRIFNLLASLAIGFFTLRITPVYKWTITLLLLSPLALSQSASYSADSLTNAFSFFFTATCLNLAFNGSQTLSKKQLIYLAIMSVAITLTKAPYAFLVGLIWIIPTEKFGNMKKKTGFFLLLVSAAIIIFIISSKINRDYYNSQLPFSDVNPNQQTLYILTHPFRYLKILIRTMYENKLYIYQSYVGILGWLDTFLPSIIYFTYLPCMFLCALCDHDSEVKFHLWQKIVLGVVGLGTVIVIISGQYITWTPVGKSVIDGVVGRYFIPVSLTLLLLFYNRIKGISKIGLSWIVPIYLVIILTLTLNTITQRFYY